MTANYLITEPAPSTTSYIRSGRGGAGNTFRAPANASTTTRVSSSSSKAAAPSSASRRFFSGIGGAGNVHRASERPAPSLDDEVRRLASREDKVSGRGHCGIGGAGNVYSRRPSDGSESGASAAAKDDDDARSSLSSTSSRSKLWAQMTGKD